MQPGSLPLIPGVKFLGCQSQKSTAMLHKAQRSLDRMFKYHYLPRKNRNLSLTHAFKKGLHFSETNTFFFRAATDFLFKQFNIKAIR